MTRDSGVPDPHGHLIAPHHTRTLAFQLASRVRTASSRAASDTPCARIRTPCGFYSPTSILPLRYRSAQLRQPAALSALLAENVAFQVNDNWEVLVKGEVIGTLDSVNFDEL